MEGSPIVSVICLAYNQKDYIASCLDSIIEQITAFPIEVIVHDDASSDGTREIIEMYSEEYPEIIRPVLQSVNQHSQGVRVIEKLVKKFAKGKYVAFCEGDDYWIDKTKLQTQYNFMENHEDYSLCLHNAIICDYKNGFDHLSEPFDGDREKTASEIILEGGGVLNPTASFFFRKNEYFDSSIPVPVGDHFCMIRLASRGRVYWMSKPMSVYRYGSRLSFTEKFEKKTTREVTAFHDKYIVALECYKNLLNGRYDQAIDRRIEMQKQDKDVEMKEAQVRLNVGYRQLLYDSEIVIGEKIKELVKRVLGRRTLFKIRRMKKIWSARNNGTYVSSENEEYDSGWLFTSKIC